MSKWKKSSKRLLTLLLAMVLAFGSVEQASAFVSMAKTKETASIMPGESEIQVSGEDFKEYVFQEGGYSLPDSEVTKSFIFPRIFYASSGNVESVILDAMHNWNTELNVSSYGCSVQDMLTIIVNIVNNNPELFYVDIGKCLVYSQSGSKKAIKLKLAYKPEYSQASLQKYYAALDKAYAEAITSPRMSDMQKALALHDYLAQHMEYDQTYSKYNAYNALVERVAVCQGYSLAYAALLKKAGIEVGYCTSDTMNHMWNIVKCDGNWYHVDVTWDDPMPDRAGYVRHRYFLNSDNLIGTTGGGGHYAWTSSQTCTSTYYDSAYWQQNDLSAIFYINGSSYYLKKTDTSYSSAISLVRRNNNIETNIYTIPNAWSLYSSGLSYYNKTLYFNDQTQIYAISPLESTPRIIYSTDGSSERLYGTLICEGKIILDSAQGSDGPTARGTRSLPADPIASLELKANASEVIYGYTTSPVLTAILSKGTSDSGEASYEWYQVTDGADGSETESKIENATGSTYTVTQGLDIGSYTYRVKVTLNGNIKTADITIIVKNAPEPPKEDTGNVPSDSGSTQVDSLSVIMTKVNTLQLYWNKVPNAMSYEVYYSTSPDGNFKRLTSTKKDNYKFSRAKCGQTYYFKVRPIIKVGKVKTYGDFCSVVSGMTVLSGAPNVYVSRTTYNSVTIRWSRVKDAKKYEIYYSTSPDGGFQLLRTQGGTSYTHRKLQTGATYYYMVRPVRDFYRGDYSNTTSGQTVLGSLVNLKVSATGTDRLKVTWKKIKGVDYYVILRSNQQDGEYEQIMTTNRTSYVDMNLNASTTYFYKVYAVAGPYKTNVAGPVGQTTKTPKQ